MDLMTQPWPWYISGPLIGLTVPLLLLFSGKTFGLSSSFRHLASICSPHTKLSYLKENDWRQESWNLAMVAGIAIGGWIGMRFLSHHPFPLLPAEYATVEGMIKLFLGGVLVGFGTRYADGCTSGHTIMGISNLKWASLVATVCFFIGGLLTTALSQLISF
jgi:uncharacterized membrane protein YedE/YeeE